MSKGESSVLAIVPARGGSKSIPRKNLVLLGGVPLIAHTLRTLQASKLVGAHVVSTDDEEIAAVARQYGGNVPELRPKELSTDTASINDVTRYLLEKAGEVFDYVLLLQPTAPLRTFEDIDAAVALASESDAESVVSLQMMETYHPHCMYYVSENKLVAVGSSEHARPRQEYPTVGWRNGAIYLVKTSAFLAQGQYVTDQCLPYLMPPERSVNIDTEEDLQLAEYYLARSHEGPYN